MYDVHYCGYYSVKYAYKQKRRFLACDNVS